MTGTTGEIYRTTDYGFLLVPDFPLLAFATALEPLRMANRLSGRELYRWRLFSADRQPVTASNGMRFSPDGSADYATQAAVIFVVSGLEAHRYCDPATLSWLRHLSRRGVGLGAISIGSVILAAAGLLDGYRCTIHWENLDTFIEAFPSLNVSPELFEIDRNRLTCSGGTAALDMMLYLIRTEHGHDLAAAVADQCIHPIIREATERQTMNLRTRLDVPHPKLLRVITEMTASLDEPLDGAAMAAHAGLSLRQLERLFRNHFDTTPKRYHLELRLRRAQRFLLQTTLPVLDVASACGFQSSAYFATCYRQFFGRSPRQERGGKPGLRQSMTNDNGPPTTQPAA